MGSSQFLLFGVGGSRFAVPVASVGGILSPGRVTPAPFVPPWVDGLVAVRGAVLPQIDLAVRLLGEASLSARRELLLLSSRQGPFLAKVDRAIRLVGGRMAPADEGRAEAGRLLLGHLTVDGDEVPVIDPERIGLEDAMAGPPPPHGETFAPPADGPSAAGDVGTATETTAPVVVVIVAGEAFSLPVGRVVEVVDLADFDRIPMAPPPLLGLMVLREQVIPVLSMSAALGGGGGSEGDAAKVVVIRHGERNMGLLVHRIVGLQRPGGTHERDVFLGRRGVVDCWIADHDRPVGIADHDRLVGIADHDRPVGMVDPDVLIDGATLSAVTAFLPRAAAANARHEPEPCRSLLTFTVGGRLCALDVGAVDRVVEWRRPVLAPTGPSHVDGVIQVRGDVLPVLDVGRYLGLEGASGAYLVAHLGPQPTALAIGRAGRITAIPLSAIHELGDADHQPMIEAVAHVGEGGLAWVLSAAALERAQGHE